jgi:hypothetical protein
VLTAVLLFPPLARIDGSTGLEAMAISGALARLMLLAWNWPGRASKP